MLVAIMVDKIQNSHQKADTESWYRHSSSHNYRFCCQFMSDLILSKVKSLEGHRGAVYGLCEGNGNEFYSSGGDGYLVKWSLDSEMEDGRLVVKTDQALFCCAFDPTKQLIAAGDLNGILYVIDAVQQTKVLATKCHQGAIYSIVYTEQHIITAGADGLLCQVDIQHLKVIKKVKVSESSLRSIYCYNDQLLIGSSDGKVYLLESDSMKPVFSFVAHSHSVFTAIADAQYLYSGGRDALLKIWSNPSEASCIEEIKAHQGTVNSLCFFGDWLISAGRDKLLRVWQKDGRLAESKGPFTGGHFHSINKVLWHLHTSTLLSASDDKTIIVWKEVMT